MPIAQPIGKYSFQHVESSVKDFWKQQAIYQKAKAKNKGKKSFYYLDGPPYTSGRIHIGHAWGRSLRDSVLRYKRMRGLDVWDRAGFDMHGLPTEHATQKKFGLADKESIHRFGIKRFIDECRTLSVENMNLMIQDFRSMGVWMDYDNPYMSINNEYIEGEWWLIKKAHENGRLYEGLRTMTWCADCATALAKHELEYENVSDNSIFLKFPVVGVKDEYIVIWTTTPWTIPFNMCVMVNPDIDYVKCKVTLSEHKTEHWIVAKALAGPFIQAIAEKSYAVVEEFKGTTLEGLKYRHPLYDEVAFFKEHEKDCAKLHTIVLSEDYVDVSAGTGLVHCAPGCGPEDYEVGHRNGLPPFNSLSEIGVVENLGPLTGLRARIDDARFIAHLEKTGLLVGTTWVNHEYPHCWRCHNPAIFRATRQWFFKVEDLKENMKELNKKIYWVPDWAGNRQFHSWLNNLRDNSITKQRYWGTPVPIWKCECGCYDVIGNSDELKEKAGSVPNDLHIPEIDKMTWSCKCGKTMKRIPDVLDVWVDAGSASWLCLDYPRRKDLFQKWFPADFIIEGKDQIRGWFNLLFVASMISMNKPSYKTVYMHGFVQDAAGRKMSKSLGNYILPTEVIEKYGNDCMRYYMIGGTKAGLDLNYNFEDMKTKFKNLDILWNLHKYLLDALETTHHKPTIANGQNKRDSGKLDKPDAKRLRLSIEEKYILSKLHSTIKNVTDLFEKYYVDQIPWVIEALFLELSRTYIKQVREKLSGGEEHEKNVVIDTLATVLVHTLTLFAPIAPFITEQIYQNLKEPLGLKEESIHLMSWPKADEKLINKKCEEQFVVAQEVMQTLLNLREKVHLGVRWPLQEAVMVSQDDKVLKAIKELEDVIKLQTNIKALTLTKSFAEVKIKIKPNYATIRQTYADKVPGIIAHLAQESEQAILEQLSKSACYELTLKKDTKKDAQKDSKKEMKETITLQKEHLIIEKIVQEPYLAGVCAYGDVYINKARTPALNAEGYAREIVRRIQNLRKDNRLVKSDVVNVAVVVDDELATQLLEWTAEMKEKCGAEEMIISSTASLYADKAEETIKGKKVVVSLEKRE